MKDDDFDVYIKLHQGLIKSWLNTDDHRSDKQDEDLHDAADVLRAPADVLRAPSLIKRQSSVSGVPGGGIKEFLSDFL